MFVLVFTVVAGIASIYSAWFLSPIVTSHKEPVAPISSSREEEAREVSDFFPSNVGSLWTYAFGKLSQQGSGDESRIFSELGRYSETVVAVDSAFGSSVRLVGVKRSGTSPEYVFCPDESVERRGELPGDPQLWYVVDRYRVFYQCTRDGAAKLASRLGVPRSTTNPGGGPEYLLPFRVGALWGADPGLPKRDDTAYQWHVEAKLDVSVPAGEFRDCYKLVYFTVPDHEIRWVCPGVGLVSIEYGHHGTIDQYRSELQSYRSGPAR